MTNANTWDSCVTLTSSLNSMFGAGMRLPRFFLAICLALVMLAASGCSSIKGDTYDETAGWSAEKLYQDGVAEMNSGNWKTASERFIAVEARYPFGIYAQQSLMNLAYVQWKDQEPEAALATINRFLQQYPNHPGTDYMLFLRGLILFTPPSAILSSLTQQDPAERDPKALAQSYEAFKELITRYPESRYAKDARDRMNWLVNTMAEHELHTARFYYDRKAYVAALNRAQKVITDFEGVPASEQALYIMMKSYEALGLNDQAKDAERVLLQNFPETKLISEGLPPTNRFSKWNPLSYI